LHRAYIVKALLHTLSRFVVAPAIYSTVCPRYPCSYLAVTYVPKE